MAKTPGRGGAGTCVKSMRSTPGTVKVGPQPGASGSVGALTLPAVSTRLTMLYCVPRRPLEVKSWANRIAGVRLQKRPAENRTAVLVSGAQEMPKRGEIWSVIEASGILAVRLKEPLGLTSEGLRIGSSGLLRSSSRTPKVMVTFPERNHWSWRKIAVSSWPKAARPASSDVNPPSPPNWRYSCQRPARKLFMLLKMNTPRQLPLNTWSIEVSLYSAPPLTTWSPAIQVSVSPIALRSVVETIGRKVSSP